MLENRLNIVEYEDCTGCGACKNVCPKDAISMQENDEGFLYPVLCKEKCINCGLCKKSCPILNLKLNDTPKNVYAVEAKDDIRQKTSSGGAFALIANNVLTLGGGGNVSAVLLDKNNNARHVLIDNSGELEACFGSKYVQSDTGDIFRQIKPLLEDGKFVFFTGTPCQVAGLYGFLQKDYENLLTADVVCHGVPSGKVLKKYLKDNFQNDEVLNLSFRDKTQVGWNCIAATVKTKDDIVCDKKYIEGFCRNIFLRKSCARCKFAKMNRAGDFTLGDFWGINQVANKPNDGKGTGLLLTNSKKGEVFLEKIKNEFQRFEIFSSDVLAKTSNYPLFRPSLEHKNREYFFKNFDKFDFNRLVDKTLNKNFDVAIEGLWFVGNYGGFLTYWALYHYIKSLNLNPVLIDNCKTFSNPFCRAGHEQMLNYIEKYGLNSTGEISNGAGLCALNEITDKFLLGSDQVWNFAPIREVYKNYFLDFANENKAKIAYSASFGNYPMEYPKETRDEVSFLLNRFDGVSVRETSGLRNLKENFNYKNGVYCLDPVFLGAKSFDILAENARISSILKDKFLFSYIVYTSEEKSKIVEYIKDKIGAKLYQVTDINPDRRKNSRLSAEKSGKTEQLEAFWNKCDMEASMEDFVWAAKNCDFVVADSFHAVCFAIIYRKDFICIPNSKQSISRFNSILSRLNLNDRALFDFNAEKIDSLLAQKINYEKVYEILNREIETSSIWLKNLLKLEKTGVMSEFDFFKKEKYLSELKPRLDMAKIQKEIDFKILKDKKSLLRRKFRLYRVLANLPFKKFKLKKLQYKTLLAAVEEKK